jgi:hypothetical protein
MALAAATLAAGVASFERITPTSTLSAVRVWLRASERISVTAFGIGISGNLEVQARSVHSARHARSHDNPSHNTMRINPVSASEIRYAVIPASLIGYE